MACHATMPYRPELGEELALDFLMIRQTQPYAGYNDHLEYIQDDEVRDAFVYLVSEAQKLREYTARPNPHGYMSRTLHYYDSASQSPFAFAVAQKWLLFYIRKPQVTHPALTLKSLLAIFPSARQTKQNEFNFRVRNLADAKSAMRLAFGRALVADGRALVGERAHSQMGRSTVADDVAAVLRQKGSATEKDALVQARLGQGAFRQAVLLQWDGKCAVTGVSVPQVIRASHIKPWRSSNNAERLDNNNGLPLIATLDALFDSGLISFGDAGNVLVSPDVPESLVSLLQLKGVHLRSAPNVQTRGYLRFHRTQIFVAARCWCEQKSNEKG